MLENGNIYVGERYLPIGAGAWDITKQYEQLVMVTHEGATYISTKPVPGNTDITNTEYWLPMYQPSESITELQDDVAQNMADIADIYQKLANGGNGSPVFVDMRNVDGVVNGNVINIDNLPDDMSKVYVVPNDKDYQMTSDTDGVRAIIAIPPSTNYNITLLSNIRLALQPIFFPYSMLIDCGNYKFTAPLPVVKQQWCVDKFNIFSSIIHTINPTYTVTSTNTYDVQTPCTVDGEYMTECAYGFTVHNDAVFKNIRFITNGDMLNIKKSAKITFEHCEFALTNSNFRVVNANDKILDLTFKDCTFKNPCAALGGSNIITNNFTFENCKFNEQVMFLDQAESLHNVRFIGCTCYETHGISLRSTKWNLDIKDSDMQIIHSGTTENATNLRSTYSQIQINGSGTVRFEGVHNSEIYLNTTRCHLGSSISNSNIIGNGTTLPLTGVGGGVFNNTSFANLDVIAEADPPVRTFSVCSFTNTTLGELNNAVYLNGDDSKLPGGGGGGGQTERLSIYTIAEGSGRAVPNADYIISKGTRCDFPAIASSAKSYSLANSPLFYIAFPKILGGIPSNMNLGPRLEGQTIIERLDGNSNDNYYVFCVKNASSNITYNISRGYTFSFNVTGSKFGPCTIIGVIRAVL